VTSTRLYSWVPPKTNYTHFTDVWTTIAGSAGVPGHNDGTNHEARFNQPIGLALDNDGNLFVADTLNNTIRKMSTKGSGWITTTIAGTAGLSGVADGTNGAARFNQPAGIAIDRAGALFVTDSLNHTIRKATPSGRDWIVTTIVGFPGANGFADGTNRFARFNHPLGIAVGAAGTLFVADSLNHTIRKITHEQTNWVVNTIAGYPLSSGVNDGLKFAARFNQPSGILVDPNGNLFVTDKLNSTIRKLEPRGAEWFASTIAGQPRVPGSSDGASAWAHFDTPSSITMDNNNNLYVTDSGNCNIRKLTRSTTNWVVSTLGGEVGVRGTNDGIPNFVRFSYPSGIAANSAGSHYYVADSLNDTIRLGGGKGTDTNIFLGRWIQTGIEAHGTTQAAH
jgi:sugar lactone lactonase YvrE